MRIIDMVNAKFPNAAQQAEKNVQSGAAFDALLAEAGRRQTFETAVNSQSRNSNENARNRTEETPKRETQHIRRNESQNTPRTEEPTSTAATAVIQEQNTATDTAETPVAIDEAQAVEKIAEILQVPAEVVMEWLQELEISAEDLTDPQAVAKILQLALDAETTAELLTNPEFPENYKAINEAIAEMTVGTKTAPVFNTTTQNTVQINNETLNVLAEDLENLEAAVKDGEIVVTESKNENSANSMRQQTLTSTATTNATTEETQEAEVTQAIETAAPVKEATVLQADEAIIHENTAATPSVNIEQVAVKVETQVVQQTATQTPVNASNVIEQIMNQVKVVSSGGQFNEIRMTLRPETLGDIVLRVVTQNGIVMAQFEAESQRVKEALEASFNQLRDALTEAGIKFSELSVSVREDENERLNQFERERQRSRHRAETIEDVSEEQEISYHNGVIDVTA